MRKNYHVTKTESGWEARLEDHNRALVKGKTKDEVVCETIDLAKKQKTASVTIHKTDGKIQEERTYPRSSDPKTSRG